MMQLAADLTQRIICEVGLYGLPRSGADPTVRNLLTQSPEQRTMSPESQTASHAGAPPFNFGPSIDH